MMTVKDVVLPVGLAIKSTVDVNGEPGVIKQHRVNGGGQRSYLVYLSSRGECVLVRAE